MATDSKEKLAQCPKCGEHPEFAPGAAGEIETVAVACSCTTIDHCTLTELSAASHWRQHVMRLWFDAKRDGELIACPRGHGHELTVLHAAIACECGRTATTFELWNTISPADHEAIERANSILCPCGADRAGLFTCPECGAPPAAS